MLDEVGSLSTLPDARETRGEEPTDTWGIAWVFPPELSRVSAFDSRLLVGRDEAADVRLTEAASSRKHAELSVTQGSLRVRDLGSLNGTFVNGRRMDSATLNAGDVVRMGGALGVVVRGYESGPCGVQEIAAGLWAGPILAAVLEPLRALARSDLPIVLEGPTGSGKERVSRAIHAWSGRGGPFVAINCAAIPEHLAEAELFGYRRGAFTGAVATGLGHLRAAEGGTLLLDEISDLPLALQAKLLRALEQREVQPIGESRAVPIDVRVVAAGQASLAGAVGKGAFRADLYARLCGFLVNLPTLAGRRLEIAGLLSVLLSARSGGQPPTLDVQFVERALLYGWPGNVRELELLVRRVLGLHGHLAKLGVEHLSGTGLATPSSLEECGLPPGSVERDKRHLHALLNGLRLHAGNLTSAANMAGISRQRAYRLLRENGQSDLHAIRRGTLA
jgi:transcriptional regulator of acetoin/glycerol metabolism